MMKSRLLKTGLFATHGLGAATLIWGALLSILLAAPSVWAQQRVVPPDEMVVLSGPAAERISFMVQLGVDVFVFIVFGVILLIARRNMKGWSQPLKDVWFSFAGRLNRKAYWLKGYVMMSMVGIAVQIFALLLGGLLGSDIAMMIGGITLLVVLIPLLVFNLWVGLAITVKRFHDLGSSGWWIFGFFIPLYNIWLAIKLAFFRGTVGPNAYGPDPIDPYDDAIEEMFGGDDGDGDADGEAAHPHPPTDGPEAPPGASPDAPKGFGARKFTRPSPAPQKVEDDFTPVEMDPSSGAANLDVIKRRLGDDILRPIKRKGGGGRDAEG